MELIDKIDAEIEEIVNDSEVTIFYKISKLNSERISTTIKASVYRGVEKVAKDYKILLDISNFYYYI